jgi:hypothetical protein
VIGEELKRAHAAGDEIALMGDLNDFSDLHLVRRCRLTLSNLR